MEDIANEYGISVSTTYDIIRLVEKTLMSCEEFKLPDKQDLKEDEPKVVVIDATECEIRRTKRGLQSTIAKILSVDFSGGRTHDFKLFKQSNLALSKRTLSDKQKTYNRLVSRLRFIIDRTSKRDTETI